MGTTLNLSSGQVPPAPPPPPSSNGNGGNENKPQRSLTEKRKVAAKRIVLWFSILTFGSGYILYLCLRFLFNEMAKKYILVALRAEGEYKPIMKGDRCIGYIARVENHRIDPDGFDVFKGSFESYAAFLAKARAKRLVEDPGFIENKLKLDKDKNNEPLQIDRKYQLTEELKELIVEADTPTVFEEIFGAVWVGFPPYHILGYQFRWLKWGQEKAKDGVPSGKVGMHPRDELVHSLFCRYPQYGIEINETETGAGSLAATTGRAKVQVDAKLVFETSTANPQKTLFRTAAISSAGDWQQALVREISDRVRRWLGSTDWDTLIQGKDTVEQDLCNISEKINGVDENDLPLSKKDAPVSSVRDYGQWIVKISMPQINLTDPSLQKAYDDVFKAEKKRDADKARAEGERALAAAPVQGEADGLGLIGGIPGGKEMYMSKQLGQLRGVYAPGRENLFLNVEAGVTGDPRPPAKKTEVTDSSGDSGKK